MAVTVTSSITGPYIPNGATTVFAFDFKAGSADEVDVYRDQVGGWVLVSSADYTASVDPEQEGGTVEFSVAPGAGSGDLYIVSSPFFTREGQYTGEGPFTPKGLNNQFDKAAVRDIALKRDVDRAFKVPLGEVASEYPSASARADKYLAFDSLGRMIAASEGGSATLLRAELLAGGDYSGATRVISRDGNTLQQEIDWINASYVTPERFGAKGDWNGFTGTDDTEALQRFLDYMSAHGVPGRLISRYRTTYTLFYGSGTHLGGQGEIWLDRPSYDDTCAFMPSAYTYADDVNWVADFSFRDFTINAPNANGISTSKARSGLLSNLKGYAMRWHFADINGCKDVRVERCYFGNSVNAPIQVDCLSASGGSVARLADGTYVGAAWSGTDEGWNRTENVVVDGNTLFGIASLSSGAIHLHRKFARGIKVINNHIDGCSRGIFDDGTTDWEDVLIAFNTVRNFVVGSSCGIRLQNDYERLRVVGNDIEGSDNTAAGGQEGIFIYNGTSGGSRLGITVALNNIRNVAKGLGLDYAKAAAVIGNTFRNCGEAPANEAAARVPGTYAMSIYGGKGVSITGNGFDSCAGGGIKVSQGGVAATAVSIIGNVFNDCANMVAAVGITILTVIGNGHEGVSSGAFHAIYTGDCRGQIAHNSIGVQCTGQYGILVNACNAMHVTGNRVIRRANSPRSGIEVMASTTTDYLSSNLVDGAFGTAQIYFSAGANVQFDEPFETPDQDGTCTLINRRDGKPVKSSTAASYTLVLADAGQIVQRNNGSANTTTVPPNSSVAFPIGTIVEIYQAGAGASAVVAGAGVTVRNAGAVGAQYGLKTLRKIATDEWLLN